MPPGTKRKRKAKEEPINCARIRDDAQYRAEKRFRAQTDLLWLAKELLGYDLVSEEYHREVADFYVQKDPRKSIKDQDKVKRRLEMDPRGTFKALDLETLIPTPGGMKRMAEIHWGDTVFGADGRPCRVIGESPVYLDRPCYEVEFSSGERIICDEQHLWETDARRDRDRKKLRSKPCYSHRTVKTTREIAETLYLRKELNHRIRVCAPIHLPEAKLPVSPYVLGAWLGDGSCNTSCLTLPEEHKGSVMRELEAEGEQVSRSGASGRVAVAGLRPRLRKLGCLEKKRIPHCYLWASAKQRLALLQGLMDTDGFAGPRGDCGFCSSSEEFAGEVRQLVASLGFRPYVFRFEAKIGEKSYGLAYRVMFTAFVDTPPFRMPRKLANLRERGDVVSNLAAHRQIVAVRPVASRAVKCIAVDSPDHLYLAGSGFIPTHNSTINMVDTIQWMICFPDCAILLLSASTPLTKGFVAEVTRHFTLARGATPTAFQELFPEYTIPPSAVKVGSYCVPSRTTGRKEDTLMSSSIESSLSGWHYDVLKEDDIVDNRNSQTPQGIATVKRNRHINKKMLMPWGYRDTIGTRYDAFDAYGDDMATAKPGELKVLVRPAFAILPGSVYAQEFGTRLSPDRFPEREDIRLLFPSLLSFEYLSSEYDADYSSFMTQYMNDAFGGREVVFDAAALKEAVLPDSVMPVIGEARIAWRFACPNQPGMHYAGATVGRLQKGRAFIVDHVRGIFTPTSLASRVVQLAKKHYTHRVQVEETPGSGHLERHIENAMVEQSWQVEIEWLPFDQDEGVRDLRLRAIEPLLTGRRLMFSAELPHLREMMQQFQAYGMVAGTELIDTVGRVADCMESSISLASSKQAGEERLAEMIERDRYERLYGMGHRVMETAEMEVVECEEETFDWPERSDEIAPGLGV